ncbi:hypothetical protein [Alkaliphilus pronyensis]|uniref:hypothetical protein n=1 Tax=Alkaliphilus pronyensis TaxID=1482732 RepID=UPI001865885E|nr:hypothetical protein [Alkaliphilus pronyensis]
MYVDNDKIGIQAKRFSGKIDRTYFNDRLSKYANLNQLMMDTKLVDFKQKICPQRHIII